MKTWPRHLDHKRRKIREGAKERSNLGRRTTFFVEEDQTPVHRVSPCKVGFGVYTITLSGVEVKVIPSGWKMEGNTVCMLLGDSVCAIERKEDSPRNHRRRPRESVVNLRAPPLVLASIASIYIIFPPHGLDGLAG